jgi:hypothetical protein
MQGKMEGLTTTNALMKEDLSICTNALFRAQEENRILLTQLDQAITMKKYNNQDAKVGTSFLLQNSGDCQVCVVESIYLRHIIEIGG